MEQQVIEAFDSELDYQKLKWGDKEQASPAEFALYIEHHLMETRALLAKGHIEGYMDGFRKIGAMAARCMELHGSPHRSLDFPVPPRRPRPGLID